MRSTARYRRLLTALSLVLASGLMLVSIVLQPRVENPAGSLAAMQEGGMAATVSVLTFAYAQLPFLIAMLGASQLIGERAPILSNLVATFGILGAFGHAVGAGATLLTLRMAADIANRDVYSGLLAEEPGPIDVPFMALGLFGTVLGILFLGIGLMRAKVGPRWVPYVLFAFLLVEFVGNSFTVWASSVAVALYLIAFVTLAVVVWRSPIEAWTTRGAESAASPALDSTTR